MYSFICGKPIIKSYIDELERSPDKARRLHALVTLTFSAGHAYMDEESIDAITKALLNDSSPDVRRHAAWSIGYLGEQEAADFLILALKDEVGSVRLETVEALGKIDEMRKRVNDKDDPNPKIISGLFQALGDHNLAVRIRALQHILSINEDNDDAIKEQIAIMMSHAETDTTSKRKKR